MLSKVKIIGFVLATLTSPLVLAQSFNAGATLFANNGCDGCHDYLGATGLQAIRDQIAQRTPPPGLNYSKSLMALTAALAGTDLDNDLTGMDALFMFTDAERADLATYIANLPNPTPILTHVPFPGLAFPPTAVGASVTQTVTVTNSGTAPLTFATNGAATIASGPFSADFVVSASQAASFCQGVTLQPNAGSCTVAVQFSPQAGASFTRSASLALVTTTAPNTTLVSMSGSLPGAPAAGTPTGTPPATQPPTGSANSPSSGGGALPWQILGLLLLALIPRRRS
jgi:Cytochrome c